MLARNIVKRAPPPQKNWIWGNRRRVVRLRADIHDCGRLRPQVAAVAVHNCGGWLERHPYGQVLGLVSEPPRKVWMRLQAKSSSA